jgi:CBS domain containing-hemolysin-like protein
VTLATEFTTSDLALLIVVAVLISIAGYIAMAETALTRMNKVKAMTLAEEQPRRGRALLRLVGHPERFLNPLLLVLLICQLVQATLVGIVSERLFGTLGIVIATIFNVVIVFVFAEAAPKTWALEHPERSALLVARPVSALVAFPPIRGVSKALIGLTNVILPGKGLKKGPFVSEEELLAFADVAVQEDVIEHEERELIESIIDFGDTVAREVMVPRLDMVTLPAGMPVSEALDVAIEHGFSRLPVVGTTVDDVKGLAYAKDLMRAEREGRGQDPVSGILRPAHFVPETKPVAVLMREMQAGKFHMALLVDEHGGIAGVVTLEDLLEELVGDIVDEYDTEDAEVERLDEGGFRVQGSVPIDELNDLLESDIPHDGWDTVGGFVLGELGRVPEPGESLKHRQWTFTVEEIEGRRVGAVRVTEDPDWEPVDDYEDS